MKKVLLLFCLIFCLIFCSCVRNPISLSKQVSSSSELTQQVEQQVEQQIEQQIETKKSEMVKLQSEIQFLEQKLSEQKMNSKIEMFESIAFWALIFSVVFFALSYFLGKIAIYISAGSIVVSACAYIFSHLIPYLFVISLCVLGLTFLIIFLRLSLFSKSAKQIIETVEKYKNEIPDYKMKFRQMIDSDVDKFIDEVRSKLSANTKENKNEF